MTKRVNFWSSPRNISTALMYSFAQRSDITVVDEPLYAHYLNNTDSPTKHPGVEEILANMEQDGEKVVKEIILGNYRTPLVLFKQMTHHLINLKLDFLAQTQNVLLIRNPRNIIASYSKVANPNMTDIGVAKQFELFEYLRKIGTLKAVVDARELLLNAQAVLKKLCDALEIPFEEAMLSWSAGPRPEDGTWSKFWYHSVHQSTGFKPYEEKKVVLSTELEILATECLPYYEKLYKYSIKA